MLLTPRLGWSPECWSRVLEVRFILYDHDFQPSEPSDADQRIFPLYAYVHIDIDLSTLRFFDISHKPDLRIEEPVRSAHPSSSSGNRDIEVDVH